MYIIYYLREFIESMKSIHEPSKVKNLFFKILWLSCLDLDTNTTNLNFDFSRDFKRSGGGWGMDKKGKKR